MPKIRKTSHFVGGSGCVPKIPLSSKPRMSAAEFKKKFAPPEIPTEETDCIEFAQYLREKNLKFSHIPNETFTKSWKTKKRNKDMGVNKGIPDYIILIEKPEQVNNILIFIEMKREKGGTVSQEQADWINALNKVFGVNAMVARGINEARGIIDAYVQ